MEDENLKKHTLHLRTGDWDYLESVYKRDGIPTSLVIRKIISNVVDKMRELEKDREPLPDIKFQL